MTKDDTKDEEQDDEKDDEKEDEIDWHVLSCTFIWGGSFALDGCLFSHMKQKITRHSLCASSPENIVNILMRVRSSSEKMVFKKPFNMYQVIMWFSQNQGQASCEHFANFATTSGLSLLAFLGGSLEIVISIFWTLLFLARCAATQWPQCDLECPYKCLHLFKETWD